MRDLVALREVWYDGKKYMEGDAFQARDLDAKILTATDLRTAPRARYSDAPAKTQPPVQPAQRRVNRTTQQREPLSPAEAEMPAPLQTETPAPPQAEAPTATPQETVPAPKPTAVGPMTTTGGGAGLTGVGPGARRFIRRGE
jgi:hypothetical protein